MDVLCSWGAGQPSFVVKTWGPEDLSIYLLYRKRLQVVTVKVNRCNLAKYIDEVAVSNTNTSNEKLITKTNNRFSNEDAEVILDGAPLVPLKSNILMIW